MTSTRPVLCAAANRVAPWLRILCLAPFLFVAALANGPTITSSSWTGGNGSWSSTTSWTNFTVPNNTGTTSYNVFIDNGLTATNSAVSLNIDVGINNLTIDAGDSLTIGNGHTLTLNTTSGVGTLLVNGTLNLASTSNFADLVIAGGTFTLTGSGSLLLSNSPYNRIYAASSTDRLVNFTAIRGAGQLGNGQTQLENRGTIAASGTGSSLVVTPDSTGLQNFGLLTATNGGTLILQNGAVANTGTVAAQAGAAVEINSTTVSGGIVTNSGGGVIRLNSGTINGSVSNSSAGLIQATSGESRLTGTYTDTVGSQLRISNGAELYFSSGSSYTINGGLFLDAGSTFADLIIGQSGVVLNGSGTIQLSDSPYNRIYGEHPLTDSLTIGASLTVQGSGQIGAGQLGITNLGLIFANQGTNLFLEPSALGFTNSGTLRANNTRLVLQNGNFNNTGGRIEALNNGSVDLSNASVTGGTFSTSGNSLIRASGGTYANITLTAGSTLEFANAGYTTLAGTFANYGTTNLNSTGSYTFLLIAPGGATLTGGGTLNLSDSPYNAIYGTTPSTVFVNQNNTIAGSGAIGANYLLDLDNRGTISANHPANPLQLDPETTVTNTGTLQAVSGGRLELIGGNFVNTGGLIRAETGSTVVFSSGANVTGGSVTVTNTGTLRLDGGSFTGGTLTNSNLGTVIFGSGHSSTLGGAITNAAGATFTIENSAGATLVSSVTNAGLITLNSAGSYTDLLIGSTSVTLAGGGTLSLSDSPYNRIYGATNSAVLINQNNTIAGAGQIGAGYGDFDNRGTVTANSSNELVIYPYAAATNSGTLQATTGSTLRLSSGAYTNTGGLIRALPGGTVVVDYAAFVTGGTASVSGTLSLGGGSFTGGTVTNASGGKVTFASGTTSTLGGTIVNAAGGIINVENGATANLLSSLNNAGLITLNSSNYYTDLIIGAGGATIAGGGVINLSNSPYNRIYGATTGVTLTNASNLITGAGQIGYFGNQFTLVNRGLVNATFTTPLTLDSLSVTNSGALQASTGSSLVLYNSAINNFSGTTAGTVLAVGSGSSVLLSYGSINGGVLTAAGGGQLRVTGTSTIGSVRITAGTRLDVLDAAQLNVAGTLTNAGTIRLNSSNNYTDLIVASGGATLTGGGTLSLSDSPYNRVYSFTTAATLTNQNNLIQGSGNLGSGALQIVNAATISANQPTALVIQPGGGGGLRNTGLLQAVGGGTLELSGSTFFNSGSIVAQTGSTVIFDAYTTIDGGLVNIVGPGSSLVFNGGTLINAVLNNNAGGTLRFSGTASTISSAVTNFSGASIVLADQAQVTAVGPGTLTNAGTILLNSSESYTDLIIGHTVTLAGGGTVQLSNSPYNRIYGIFGGTGLSVSPPSEHPFAFSSSSANSILINQDNTIQGSGYLGENSLDILNSGTIVANQSTALVIQPGSGGLTNSGTLRATRGATLALSYGTFDNTGGRIEALNASVVEVGYATVSGGTLFSTGTGAIRSTGYSTFANLTLTTGSTLNLQDGSVTNFLGNIGNFGQINLSSANNYTDIAVDAAGATLNGTGVLQLSNSPYNRIYANAATTFTNNSAILGAGQFGNGLLSVVNQGLIEANQANALYFSPAGTFTNQGTLRASGTGGLFYQNSQLANTGTVDIASGSSLTLSGQFLQSSGLTKVAAGGSLNATSITINGGNFAAAGTVTGPVTNNAHLVVAGAPAGIGTLTFTSPVLLGSTSLLSFELGGTAPGTGYDVVVAPTITLGGTLDITFANGFQTSVRANDTFTLITTTNANGLSGLFAGYANGSRLSTFDGFGSFQVNYLPNALTLSNFSPVPEPSTVVLLGLGGALLVLRAWHRRRGSDFPK